MRHFPFDCQWLAITVSLKAGWCSSEATYMAMPQEEGCARNRSFLFQYCEAHFDAS